MRCIPVPPQLEINKVLFKDQEMPLHVRVEQRIVWNLLLALEAKGFIPHSVDDGDEVTSATTKKAAMELIFNLDEAHLYLSHNSGEKNNSGKLRTVWIRLILGNEIDIISDYNANSWNGFNKCMDEFKPELFA